MTDRFDAYLERLKTELSELESKTHKIRESYKKAQEVQADMREKLNMNDQQNEDVSQIKNSLNHLSLKECLRKLAEENNGILKVADAKEKMVKAGFFKSNRNASNSIYPTLYNMGQFKKIEPGIYRYTALQEVKPSLFSV